MDLDKKIKSLGDRFLGFEKREGFNIVKVIMPENWVLTGEKTDEYEIAFVRDKQNKVITSFVASIGCEYSTIIDLINKNISTNNEREFKSTLLLEKIKELTKIFDENNLVKLEKLVFTFKDKPKYNKKQTSGNTVVEENENNILKEK